MFFKNRYVYNPNTLSYVKVQLNLRDRIYQYILAALGFCAFISLLSFGIFYYFFNTATYKAVKREKDALLVQYKKLNKKLEAMNASLASIQEKDDNLYRVLLDKQPIPSTVRQAGYGGSDQYENLRGYDNSNVLVETSKKIDLLSKKLDIQASSYSELIISARLKRSELLSMPAIRPVSDRRASISSMFGYRMHPILKRRRMHEGLDFTAPIGTPVYAPADGTVESTGYEGGLGRCLKIRHGFGYVTLYGHLSKINVEQGAKVKRGELVALIGNSGLSSGPHLHYEIRRYGILADPINYFFNDINPEDYNKMLMASAEQKKEAGK